MKKTFAVSVGILLFLISSLFIASCNNDDGPAEIQTPLVVEPSSISVTTGTTGLVAVSGGVSPYSILTAPSASVATATITTFGVLTVTPVAAGSATVTVQDHSDPPRIADIPITVTTGYGDIAVNWTINGQSPTFLCAQVASTLVRVSVDGNLPATGACGSGTVNIDNVSAGNHIITAELLSASMTVLSTFTDTLFIAANYTTNVIAPFYAPLIIGNLHVTWTINGQPSGSGCGNATSVRAQLGSFSPASEPCSRGQLTMSSIPAGTYTFVADLLDANNTSLSHGVMTATIIANQTANLSLNFTTGPVAGSANINWTVNNGQNCPTNGYISISATGPSAKTVNTTCNSMSSQITNLGPGSYTFDITLTDPAHPGMTATAQAQDVTITANSTTVVTRNIDCLFCSGTDSTGWVQVDVSCGGSACGLTGTLYVIIKDCSVNAVPLNTGTVLATTLSAGSPVSHTVANVLSGGRCVKVFLDVDGNGRLNTGDAVATFGEKSIVVLGGQTTNVSIMLDTVSP